jgi:hypothetical protein
MSSTHCNPNERTNKMTIRKSHSVSAMTLCSLIMLSCALLLPTRAFATSGGGCGNNNNFNAGGANGEVSSCLYTNLSGSVTADMTPEQHPLNYTVIGVWATVTNTSVNPHQVVYSGRAYVSFQNDNPEPVTLNFPAYAGISGDTYTLTTEVCGQTSTAPLSECSNWVVVTPGAPPPVIY